MDKYSSAEDQALVQEFDDAFAPGVVIVKRAKTPTAMSRKVNVYVDGLLQTMSEDVLNMMIDNGFYVVVKRKPGGAI